MVGKPTIPDPLQEKVGLCSETDRHAQRVCTFLRSRVKKVLSMENGYYKPHLSGSTFSVVTWSRNLKPYPGNRLFSFFLWFISVYVIVSSPSPPPCSQKVGS
jgi:hypothetical protein